MGYGPAEDFVGAFISLYGVAGNLTFHTKWFPHEGQMPKSVVLDALDQSRTRMDVETLDLVSFDWPNYRNMHYLELFKSANALKDDQVLRSISLANFDTVHLKEIVGSGVDIVSVESSYSIIDTRPRDGGMAEYCAEHGIKILSYGSLLGGILSDSWLNKPRPNMKKDIKDWQKETMERYLHWVDLWGGWPLLQELLQTLRVIANKHAVSISAVALRWVIQQEAVGSAIVGMRVGETAANHIDENRLVFSFELDPDDMKQIATIQAKGRPLYDVLGDCGAEFRS